MSKNQTSRRLAETKEIIGYPGAPLPLWLLILAAAAWGLGVCFLLAMAYLRRIEWPFYPT